MPPALEAWSLNHWTTRDFPAAVLFLRIVLSPCKDERTEILNSEFPMLTSEWQSRDSNPGLSGSTCYALSLETGCLCENVQLAWGCCPAWVRLVMRTDSYLIKGSFVRPYTLTWHPEWLSVCSHLQMPCVHIRTKTTPPCCLLVLAVIPLFGDSRHLGLSLRVHWRHHGGLSHLDVLSITQHRVWLRGRAQENICQMNEWRDGWITSGLWVRLRLA